jgi:hypothetical protein
MKIEIDLTQASTKRGLVWLVAAIIGLPMAWAGKDVSQLVALAMGIAGGLGVLVKD